ncbi:MAG TPA: copper amine oxidase N-terminal domain-containing protein [bacterium]
MWRSHFVLILILALALAILPSAPAAAQAVRVIVDGSPVFFDQPPVTIGGRVLIPLRGVFEQLGAFVQWNPASNTVLATRGASQIQLTIGSRVAFVNGRQVRLDVPPMVVGGRTLVPLRFVSEAMGANVDWEPSTRTVFITSGGAAQPRYPPPPVVQPPQPPVVQPPQPPVPSQSVIQGTVFRVDTANARLYVQRENQIHTIIVTADTAITRTDTGTGAGGAVSLGQLRVGDAVTVTLDAQGRAILVRATTREVAGRIDAVSGRTIVLAGGQVFTLPDDAVVTLDGRSIAPSELRPGMEATVRVNPQTNAVAEVSARAVGVQPPPPAQARITSITHTADRPLRAGETLTVTIQGTRGGQATFDVFGVTQGVAMTEVSPGVYRGTYRIQPNDNVLSAGVFGHLRVGGQEAVLVQAGNLVSVDGRVPLIRVRMPEPNTVINNTRPNILITFDDQGGSGVNPANSTLVVNGQNVTGSATWSETAVAYTPPQPLPQGTIRVQTVLRDRAGNQTTDTFAFSVSVVQGALVRAVTVNPTPNIRPGQVLTVTALGEPGSQATFSIEGVVSNVAMPETQPGVYVGQFTVGNQTAQNARVLVTLNRAGQTATVEASGRLSFIGAAGVAVPTITSPRSGTRVESPFTIRGTALPGSRVVVRVDYSGTMPGFQANGTYGEVATTADASGNWQVSVRTSVRIPNARLTITVRAVDPGGRESAAATVQVVQSGEADRP